MSKTTTKSSLVNSRMWVGCALLLSLSGCWDNDYTAVFPADAAMKPAGLPDGGAEAAPSTDANPGTDTIFVMETGLAFDEVTPDASGNAVDGPAAVDTTAFADDAPTAAPDGA